MATNLEILTKLNTALDTRMAGGAVASYSTVIGGTTVNFAKDPLDSLMRAKLQLESIVAAEQSSGGTTFACFEDAI